MGDSLEKENDENKKELSKSNFGGLPPGGIAQHLRLETGRKRVEHLFTLDMAASVRMPASVSVSV